MNKLACILTGLALLPPMAPAGAGEWFDVLAVTPVGSWQLRETITTDHKGKKRVSVLRTSLIDAEKRGGEPYVWIETEVTNYKLKKKGERKKDGDTAVVKVLVKESALRGDPANIVNNLSGLGEEIIFQSGKNKPMKLSGGGAMAQGMMKALGTKVTFDFQEVGEEKVEIPAGNFVCTRVTGTGSAETKVLIKKIKVESESEMWLSAKVPFGLVKSLEQSKVNGKPQSGETVLLEYGDSGAVSKITEEPTSMPGFKNPFGR